MSDPDFPQPEQISGVRTGIAWVWLMPLLALAISAYVLVEFYRGQGPLIVVSLPVATGIEAGETPLRFRDVEVGLVESIELSDDFAGVDVFIRLDPNVAAFVDADAQFWLVEPEVSLRGVTGLTTVLSGVYFEGTWDGEPGPLEDRFIALERTPLSLPLEEGTRIVLRAPDSGALAAGAPLLFNGIEVGRLGTPRLEDTGSGITMDAFIEAPHDQRLTTTTRFWDISGLSVDLSASGVTVNFASLASLVEGGIAFDGFVTGGDPITDGTVFDVFPNRDAAQRSIFDAPLDQALSLAILMPADNLRLSLGAAVRFGGVRVGEVTSIIGYTDPRAPEEGVQILVTFAVSPARIGLGDATSIADVEADLAQRVADGLRARVASEGLLGGTLIVELLEQGSRADAGRLVTDLVEVPLMPSLPPDVTEASANLGAMMARVGALPIEELMAAAIDALDGVARLSNGDELNALPANVNALVTEARSIVAADEIQSTLSNLSMSAAALQGLVAGIAESDGLATALSALEDSDVVFDNIVTFTDGLPEVQNSIETLIAQLDVAPITSAAASADRVLLRVEEILATEGAENLPTSLDTSLTELAAILTALREGGAVDNINGTLASAETAFGALQSAAEEVPTIVTRLNGLVASLQELSGGYDENSPVYRELRSAIGDISQTADAFRSLARTIEGNPSALIRGR